MKRHAGRGKCRRWATLGALVLASALGCQQQQPGATTLRVIPEPEAGQVAVTTALAEWKCGREPGTIDTVRPAIVVVDSHRKPGQTLERYEILGQVEDDNSRTYTVRVSMANPQEEPLLRFHVFGREPLWVFRQEDYDMLSHWECPPPEAPAAQAAAEAGPVAPHKHNEAGSAASHDRDARIAGTSEVASP